MALNFQWPAVEEDPTRLRRVRDSAVDRIRLNREKRKHRINNGSGSGEEDSGRTSSSLPKCPSCSSEVDDVDLVEHLEVCLKTPEEAKRSLIEGEEGDDGEDLDVDGDGGGYETYTWAGHTRIRATSLVDGGLRGAGFMTITKVIKLINKILTHISYILRFARFVTADCTRAPD